jgi:acetyl-CoA carboxylase carboxyl transferase subunit alpha
MWMCRPVAPARGQSHPPAPGNFSSLTPAQRLQVARHPRRPSTLDYIQSITDEWIELHGDRSSGKDDPALVGGVARLEGRPW